MTGFSNPTKSRPLPGGAPFDWPPVTLGHTEIDKIVNEANQQRSAAIGAWLRRMAENWSSLWRRPGRAVPSNLRGPKIHA